MDGAHGCQRRDDGTGRGGGAHSVMLIVSNSGSPRVSRSSARHTTLSVTGRKIGRRARAYRTSSNSDSPILAASRCIANRIAAYCDCKSQDPGLVRTIPQHQANALTTHLKSGTITSEIKPCEHGVHLPVSVSERQVLCWADTRLKRHVPGRSMPPAKREQSHRA